MSTRSTSQHHPGRTGRVPIRRRLLAATSVAALVCTSATAAVTVTAGPAAAAPDPRSDAGSDAGSRLTTGATQARARLGDVGRPGGPSVAQRRSAGVPEEGAYTFLLELEAPSTVDAFQANRARGTAAAESAATSQLARVERAQDRVVAALPARSPVLYRTSSALAGVAVSTDVDNLSTLEDLPGVAAVYPVAPKRLDNATAVPLQEAPTVWSGVGSGAGGRTGEGVSIGVIDTGIDFTHAAFGGPGTVEAFEAADAVDTLTPDPALYGPGAKVVGGYDFVGDAYNADPSSDAFSPDPQPDDNPLDCNGHGSHVAGSAAGLGVTRDGAPYAGDYDTETPFEELRIGPGMAPGADLYALRVFGCEGSTDVTAAAIDWATDPNRDGNPEDRLDVVNLSLGSDFGSPLDGDAVVSDAAADLGVVLAMSSGNSGDQYDVGGSPGAATKAIAVASSVDSTSVVDALTVSIDGEQQTFGASRAAEFAFGPGADFSGQEVVEAPTGNADACTAYPAGTFDGEVVIVQWTQEALECGSVQRGTNLAAAGAGGYIFHNDSDTFTGTIAGVPSIPGVLLEQTGGDRIRAALRAGDTVTADSTEANAGQQVDESLTDTLSDFSSRGIRGEGALKPDVTAVGQSVFSAAVGTGAEGVSLNGTSMAAPMTAGLAALVREQNPGWTSEQVKADIMNTAGADLFTEATDVGARYAPNRVGSGRIQAVPALANEVLAYVTDDPGAVSVSFGPVEVTGPTTLTKTVRVQNTGTARRAYTVGYDAITQVPGVSYVLSTGRVDVPAGGSGTVDVTFTVTDASRLTKTVDVTHGRVGATDLPLETLADASGNLTLTPDGATGSDGAAATAGPALRVPVYSAPRPASRMTQPAQVTFPVALDGSATAPLVLSGTGVDQGTGAERVRSVGAGLQLQAVSDQAPTCTVRVTTLCVTSELDRPADLKYVGTATDDLGVDAADRMLYVGITAHAPSSTPGSKLEHDVLLDVDGDLAPDLVAFNTRVGQEDVFVVSLADLATGEVVDTQLLNNRDGDLDLAVLDSDTMLLPISLDVLADYGVDAENPRVGYGVQSFSAYTADAVDAVGLTDDGSALSGDLSTDVVTRGLSVTQDGTGPLFLDQPGVELTLRRDAASYAADRALGAMIVHFHNEVGSKAEVVLAGVPSTTTLTVTPPEVSLGASTTLSVAVAQQGGSGAPTGQVSVVDLATGAEVASGALVEGVADLPYTPGTVGTQRLRALYAGSPTYAPSGSETATLTTSALTGPVPTVPPGAPGTPPTVPAPPTRVAADVAVRITPQRGTAGRRARVAIRVTGVGAVPTGKVKLRVDGELVRAKRLRDGRARMGLRPQQTVRVRVVYVGDPTYLRSRSTSDTYRVR